MQLLFAVGTTLMIFFLLKIMSLLDLLDAFKIKAIL